MANRGKRKGKGGGGEGRGGEATLRAAFSVFSALDKGEEEGEGGAGPASPSRTSLSFQAKHEHQGKKIEKREGEEESPGKIPITIFILC